MPGVVRCLGCSSWVDPTHPMLTSAAWALSVDLVVPSLTPCLALALSPCSAPFLLTDPAHRGPGGSLPGAHPCVSLLGAPGSLGRPAAAPAECAPQDVAARGHPSGHRDEDPRRGPGKGWQVRPQAPEARVGGVPAQLAQILPAQTPGRQSHVGPRALRIPGHCRALESEVSPICPVTVSPGCLHLPGNLGVAGPSQGSYL